MLQPWKDRSADKLQSSPGTSELPLEQSTGLLVSPTLATSVVRALYARDWRVEQVHSRAVLPRPDHALIPVLHLEARLHPREGDERLSGSQKGETRGADGAKRPSKTADGDKKGRKQRSSDVGRALRTVYDDTLRESVPGDFLDLLGKLS